MSEHTSPIVSPEHAKPRGVAHYLALAERLVLILIAVVLSAVVPVTWMDVSAVPPTTPLKTALPVTVSAFAPSTVEPKVAVVAVRLVLAPKMTAPV